MVEFDLPDFIRDLHEFVSKKCGGCDSVDMSKSRDHTASLLDEQVGLGEGDFIIFGGGDNVEGAYTPNEFISEVAQFGDLSGDEVIIRVVLEGCLLYTSPSPRDS